ncbi:MAG TPA: hypothetical protein VGB03_08100 [Acidimicrobiales bacterium]|jgi:hypothetical protein
MDVDAIAALIPVLVVAVFALVIVVAVHHWRTARKRREDLALWAATNGMELSLADPYGLHRLDFTLFTRGDGRGCENVVSGTWQGLDVRVADYWYYETSHDSDGGSSRDYSHFSVVMARVDAWLPHVELAKENVLTRLADHLAMRDLEFESEEFNRRFNVKAGDREFAYKLLDARMLEWLLHTAGPHSYEVSGDQVLAYCGRLPVSGLPALLHAVKGFVDHVPRLVWADYGKGAP